MKKFFSLTLTLLLLSLNSWSLEASPTTESWSISVGVGKLDGPMLVKKQVRKKPAYLLSWVGTPLLNAKAPVRVVASEEYKELKQEIQRLNKQKKLLYKQGLVCRSPVQISWLKADYTPQVNQFCWDVANKKEKLALQMTLRKAKKLLSGESLIE